MSIVPARLALLLAPALAALTGCSDGRSAAADGGAALSVDRTAVAAAPEESAVCEECHENHYSLWIDGGHSTLGCQTCHGPAGEHIQKDIAVRPKMKLETAPRLCMTCHRCWTPSGPSGVPRIAGFEAHLAFVSDRHKVAVDRQKIAGRCTFCHDPHSLQ